MNRSWKKLVISIVEGNFRRTKSLKQIAELLKILKILKRSQVSLSLQNFPKSTNPQKKSWNLHLAYPTATLYNPQPLDTHGAAGCSVPRWSVGAALGDAPSSGGWGVWKLREKGDHHPKPAWKKVEKMLKICARSNIALTKEISKRNGHGMDIAYNFQLFRFRWHGKEIKLFRKISPEPQRLEKWSRNCCSELAKKMLHGAMSQHSLPSHNISILRRGFMVGVVLPSRRSTTWAMPAIAITVEKSWPKFGELTQKMEDTPKWLVV